ncbi:unnamed protein product, partial [Vitis vinifera]|uniref:Uncharacterized protein n=1 Tax=Vitis vinifera TaxID=29760 RepID=D7T7S6_VITVI
MLEIGFGVRNSYISKIVKPIDYISGVFKWPKGLVVFTSHIEKCFLR